MTLLSLTNTAPNDRHASAGAMGDALRFLSPMQTVVRLPSALRSHTKGETQINVTASTVEQALHALEERFQALAPYLRDEAGQLRPGVNIYVNDEHVRYRQGTQTPLQDGDTVFVVPIIMGG